MKLLYPAAAVLLLSVASFASTLHVPQDYATVQDAVAASVSGDTILVSPGLYSIPAAACTLANGAQSSCGLVLHDGTTLAGSGPAQTVLDFSGAIIGSLLQNGTATVKLAHLQNAGTAVYAYVGSNLTVSNVIITKSHVGTELNQGNSYTVINTTMDGIHDPSHTGSAIDIPFGGTADIENNLVTNSDRAFTAGSFSFGTYAYNDAFGSTIGDWSICDSSGCSPITAPVNNISANPLYCQDYSLQTGSPARNTGDPAILNPDGTRSDIGGYGGPEAIASTSCGFLSFSLLNKTAQTAKINSVFDHTPQSPYCANNSVVAYTGDKGDQQPSSLVLRSVFCSTTQDDNDLFGFSQAGGSFFSLHGQYTGGQFLFYDGHPGYDYQASCHDSVFASTSGTVHYPSSIPGLGPNGGKKYHILEILPDSPNQSYRVIYLHLSTYPTSYCPSCACSSQPAPVAEGQHVNQGYPIGEVGDAGTPAKVHLHFEIQLLGQPANPAGVPVDPYGWQGAYQDPYLPLANNVNLWK